MMTGKDIIPQLNSPEADKLFLSLYGPEGIGLNRRRYTKLAEELLDHNIFSFIDVPPGEVIRLYTAAGRTELGGNHTDHNRGKILAASINLDIAAAAVRRQDGYIVFRSSGFPDAVVCLDELRPKPEERGTTEALIRGIASVFVEKGVPVGGITVNADSMVFPGSGLSSSAAVEALFGKIIDDLYGQGNRSSLEIAQIGQYAENTFFGKPCGLMDQIACATGGPVLVDFADPQNPKIEAVPFDPANTEFLLCMVNTGGNHADLTSDYAAIPDEMKSVAAFLGKSVLRDVNYKQIILRGNEIRKSCGDRALLRAIHYFTENRRVDAMVDMLRKLAAAENLSERNLYSSQFLQLVNESGNSSWELLQNVYAPANIHEQSLSLALALTHDFLTLISMNEGSSSGGCRVHGGGFAGVIQAYIPRKAIKEYVGLMERFFGLNSVTPIRIRSTGAARLSVGCNR